MKKRIMLVDDSPMIHEMMGARLEGAGYEVLHAEDGFSAINMTLVEMPDLILLDIVMPTINGYQVCRLLKDLPETADVPIVLITGEGTGTFVKDPMSWSFKTGAEGFLDKADSDKVLEFIKPYLEKGRKEGVRGGSPAMMSEIEILSAVSRLLDKQLYLDIERLEELNEKKNAFVANVSHELGSPLAVIKGYLDYLIKSISGKLDERQNKVFSIVENMINRLTRLLDDLLDMSSIEAGTLRMNFESTSLEKIVKEVIESYDLLLKDNDLEIKTEFCEGIPLVNVDKDRIVQVVVNLLNNAIKFTPSGGTITARIIPEQDVVRFEMHNTGQDIDKEDEDRIFDKFESVGADKGGGTGLGLPIARDIITLHGGKIWVESAPGEGTTFKFTLPIERERHI